MPNPSFSEDLRILRVHGLRKSNPHRPMLGAPAPALAPAAAALRRVNGYCAPPRHSTFQPFADFFSQVYADNVFVDHYSRWARFDRRDPRILGPTVDPARVERGIFEGKLPSQFMAMPDYITQARLPERYQIGAALGCDALPPPHAAIFDLDNNLVDGVASRYFVKFLLSMGNTPRGPKWRNLYAYLRNRAWDKSFVTIIELGAKTFEEMEETRLRDLTEIFWDTAMSARFAEMPRRRGKTLVRPFAFPDGVETLRRHQTANHITAVASASHLYLCEGFSRRFGIDFSIGSLTRSHGGIITGDIVHPLPLDLGKAALVLEYLRRVGVDPSQCDIYTDDIGIDSRLFVHLGTPETRHPTNCPWDQYQSLAALQVRPTRFDGVKDAKDWAQRVREHHRVDEHRLSILKEVAHRVAPRKYFFFSPSPTCPIFIDAARTWVQSSRPSRRNG